jgi:hypothetical protein
MLAHERDFKERRFMPDSGPLPTVGTILSHEVRYRSSGPGGIPMRSSVGRTRVIAAVLLLAYLSACSSWRVENVSPQALIEAKHPTQVRVSRPDGTKQVLHHPSIGGDTLRGSVQEPAIPLDDVQTVETRHGDTGKSLLPSAGSSSARWSRGRSSARRATAWTSVSAGPREVLQGRIRAGKGVIGGRDGFRRQHSAQPFVVGRRE